MAENYPTVPLCVLDVAATLEDFRIWLIARKGLASNTADNHVGAVRRQLSELGLDPPDRDVDRFVVRLRESGASFSHIINTLAGVERYLEFLGRPIELGRPRKPRPLPKPGLSEAEIAVLIHHCETIRDKAIVAVMAFAGIRNAEICALRVRDAHLAEGYIHVRAGKNDCDYRAHIGGPCVDLLLTYTAGMASDELLFRTARSKQELEPQDLRKLVKRIAKRAGMERSVYPHLLRHSLATALLFRGASFITIQNQLGHRWPETTLHYLRGNYAALAKSEYNRCAPSFM